jgi:hypothetical protein
LQGIPFNLCGADQSRAVFEEIVNEFQFPVCNGNSRPAPVVAQDSVGEHAPRSATLRHFRAWALALTLAGVLPGCAAYTKCGFSGCPGDAQITADVRALFDQHPELEPPNLINVRTLDHVVYLSGLVDTDSESQMAEAVALQAAGVKKVVNSIGLSGGR